METSKQIIQLLDELAQVLLDLQVQVPFHLLIAGGAFMLIRRKRQFTEDIDFALVEAPAQFKGVVPLTFKRAEVSKRTVPYGKEFRQAVEIIARRHEDFLPEDWLNDEAAVYYYDDAPQAEATFWRSFKGVVYVYLPTMEYMFATKIAASRAKDVDDIKTLIKVLKVKNKTQAKAIIDRFLLPEAQAFWEVDNKLDLLFP